MGRMHYYTRQYDQAIEQSRRVLEMDSSFAPAYVLIGDAYIQKGMHKEAINELNKARTVSGDEKGVLAELGYAYAVAGQRFKVQKILRELNNQTPRAYIDPGSIAIIFIGLGDKDQAIAWLEKAYDVRSTLMTWLKVEPKFDSLRSDPRFTALLKKVGLEK